MITERTLKRWRRESLTETDLADTDVGPVGTMQLITVIQEQNKRILRMTQELLDQHLIRK